MASVPEYGLTPDEYLRMERAAELKSEYDDGVVLPMSGENWRHNLIAMGLLAALGNHVRKDCFVLASLMKIRILNPTRFFYPDASVVCGRPQLVDEEEDVLLNPLLVVEVLSENTARRDRGRKFLSYQQIASLSEYLLVSQDEALVEHFRREAEHWVYTKSEGLEATVNLPAVGCELSLREIYAQVDFTSF